MNKSDILHDISLTVMILTASTRILAGDTLVVITGNGQELNTVRALTGRGSI